MKLVNQNLLSAFATVLLSAVCLPVQAQDEDSAQWPCIQRLVPTVEAAVLWPGEIDDTKPNEWLNDGPLSKLARELGDLDEVSDEKREEIAQFAEALPASERELKLNQLAQGVLSVANERRSLFIEGIKRYTKQQIAVARKIEEHRNSLHEMDVKQVDESDSARKELEETVHWQQRIFDKRENAIQSLCDQPVAVEETLGEVLREISQYLP